jgi:hypothetical protein
LTGAIGATIGGTVNAMMQVRQIRDYNPCLTFQDAFSRIDVGQVAGAAAAGGFMGLTLGIGAGGLGSTMILGAVGGGLGGQVGALTEAAWDEGTYVWHGDQLDTNRFIQTAKNQGFGDLAKIGVDGGVGMVSAAVGHGMGNYVGQRFYVPNSSNAPIKEITLLNSQLGVAIIQDLGKMPEWSGLARVSVGEIVYELLNGTLEEFLQIRLGEWVDQTNP